MAKRRDEQPANRDRGHDQRKNRPPFKHVKQHNRPDDVPRFTPLNRPLVEVLQFAEQCNLVHPPEPVPEGEDKSKYCAFHRVKGHNTSECMALRVLIEQLIQNGELGQFVMKGDRNKGKTERNVWKRNPEKNNKAFVPPGTADEKAVGKKPVIHVIYGGPEGGDSSRQRKQWARNLYVGTIHSEPREKKKRTEPISFTDDDLPLHGETQNDPLVVTLDVSGTDVQRVLVDTGSSVNILYFDVFTQLGLSTDRLTPIRTPLSGFTGDSIEAEGVIRLDVELGSQPNVLKTTMDFVVVKLKCVHNAILGRPGITRAAAVISMSHLCMKFHTPNGIGVVRGDQRAARQCYVRAVKQSDREESRIHTISQQVDHGELKEKPQPASELEEIILDSDRPERVVKIGRGLPVDLREDIIGVLQRYKNVFAWGPEDMLGVDRSVICHRLSIQPGSKPVKQKKRHLSSERREFVKKETATLLAVGHVREVLYPEWLANVVLAPKPPTWRMCVDYTDLNKACPKDPYPLPNPDQMVDETAGYGVFCYVVMAFGLRNSGATYQRMVNKLFKGLLGSTMEAYVDDMLIKSRLKETHPADLARAFKILKKSNGFEWTPACQSAFEDLKVYLSSAPVLSKPEKDEVLFVYLAVSDRAVSSVLVREENKGIQKPIYYVSKALQGPELRYTKFEKTALALWATAKRLAAYFQAHPIVVLTDQPLGTILRNPTSSGRLIKWAMMLTQFAIEYKPRPAIKGQALVDFIVECTARDPEPDRPTALEEPWWEVSTDGSSSKKGCGGGIVLTSPEGFKIYQALIFKFQPTNNEAEYEALIGGLRLAKQMKAERLRARSDSRLIIGQLSSTIDAKEDRMIQYKDIALELLQQFKKYELIQIPRMENTDADMLSKLTQEAPEYVSKIARIEEVGAPSIDVIEVHPVEIGEPDWMYDLKNYIANGTLPDDSSRAKKVKLRAPRFQLVDDRLYKRSYGGPLLRCLTNDEAKIVMEEVHEGICSAHQGPRTLAQKIVLMGYYWPSINLDCEQYVRRCATCQEFHKLPGRPATYYQPVSEVIPFARWGVDLIGAFPMAAGRKKYVIVAIDYFTKWVEAKALATITSQQCQKFLWKNVITRFGVPVQLITDNGTQFDSRPFKNFMAHLGIRHTRVAVAYPQANGQVENTNRTILDGLKKKLQTAGRGWVEELSYVLWTYRTTPRRATNETPFSLTYGFETKKGTWQLGG
ncbi:uncharacterized protein LOC116016181 [Ipomoea triloba]|uniref:uncharacterized protein LOC116016181 n=1 Tax=Ipomoea triloba TaxID=35885 RepID=UPI00125E596C|nr:uncharacterized protein LOC116016181 [Ipomoea triloba]